MKKFKFLGFVALAALIILGMVGCQMATDALSGVTGDGTGDGTPQLRYKLDDFSFGDVNDGTSVFSNSDGDWEWGDELNLNNLKIKLPAGLISFAGGKEEITVEELLKNDFLKGLLEKKDPETGKLIPNPTSYYDEEQDAYFITIKIEDEELFAETHYLKVTEEDGEAVVTEVDPKEVITGFKATSIFRISYGFNVPLNLNGLRLYYADNHFDPITDLDGYAVEGFDSVIGGSHHVTVTYKAFTYEYDITVSNKPRELKVIEVTGLPTTIYAYNEEPGTLNLTGLVVTAYFDDGTDEILNAGDYEITTEFDPTYYEKAQEIWISYTNVVDTEGYKFTTTKETYFEVTVEEPLFISVDSINIDEVNKEYAFGTDLNFDGIVIVEIWEDGPRTLYNKDLKPGDLTISGYNSKSPSKQLVTITYKKTDKSFYVTVLDPVFKSVKSVDLSSVVDASPYKFGTPLALSGIKIVELWEDGEHSYTYNTLVQPLTQSVYNPEQPGEQVITFTYRGENYPVTVIVKPNKLNYVADFEYTAWQNKQVPVYVQEERDVWAAARNATTAGGTQISGTNYRYFQYKHTSTQPNIQTIIWGPNGVDVIGSISVTSSKSGNNVTGTAKITLKEPYRFEPSADVLFYFGSSVPKETDIKNKATFSTIEDPTRVASFTFTYSWVGNTSLTDPGVNLSVKIQAQEKTGTEWVDSEEVDYYEDVKIPASPMVKDLILEDDGVTKAGTVTVQSFFEDDNSEDGYITVSFDALPGFEGEYFLNGAEFDSEPLPYQDVVPISACISIQQ